MWFHHKSKRPFNDHRHMRLLQWMIPEAPRKASVARFRLLAGHDCLRSHLTELVSQTHLTVLSGTLVSL
ncbi:hypothetical protein TNCT_365001 [Trichonephila clavata]|uniref:Uncharacterized protein n=1 Tax=Trichonephila clavata TaxID=2740835 RepID=A0A8X6LHH6_TRICU|nr:hypothetical protein TNCT_365001 [Trichonephila clavata]